MTVTVTKDAILAMLEKKRQQVSLDEKDKEIIGKVLLFEFVEHERNKIWMYTEVSIQKVLAVCTEKDTMNERREIYTPKNKLASVKKFIEDAGFNVCEGEYGNFIIKLD